ncbi:hypothetical protein D4R51_03780 [bacterium]|nr:MAG: hypothetical protein D4R51_03780 [bacterium]
MMKLAWWAILLIVIVVVAVVYTVKGFIVARRCRKIFKKENEDLPINHDEDSESGGSDST